MHVIAISCLPMTIILVTPVLAGTTVTREFDLRDINPMKAVITLSYGTTG